MGYTPPQLEVRKIAGGYSIFPPTTTTGDDITIYPNGTDTAPYIKIFANSNIVVGGYPTTSGGSGFSINDTANLKFTYTTPDWNIESTTADKNIYLKTTGTGVIKFGTYTAGAATDSTGYITILDAAGNTRKLMVQA